MRVTERAHPVRILGLSRTSPLHIVCAFPPTRSLFDLELATLLLDTGADVVTESGEPGISAALHFSAGAANF